MKLAWLISGRAVSKSPSRMIGLRPRHPKSTRRRYRRMKRRLTRVDSVVPRKAKWVCKHASENSERKSLLVSDAASPPDPLPGFHLSRRQDILPAHLPVLRRSIQPKIKSLTEPRSANRKYYKSCVAFTIALAMAIYSHPCSIEPGRRLTPSTSNVRTETYQFRIP